MDRSWTANNQAPNRLPARWAWVLLGLSLVAFSMAFLGLAYEGWHRVAYLIAFGTMGLANFALAVGNLLPDGRASRAALVAVGPLVIVMSMALGANLAFMVGCGW